jgi:acetyl esterase/lipase
MRVGKRGLVNGKRYGRCEIRGCTKRPAQGDRIYACKECKWSVCESCNDERLRMPTLALDPLFHGPDEPALLSWLSISPPTTLGTVIICPGGNYEFLSPLEGLPVVEWLQQHGIGAVVLRHRLLPDYCLDDCLDDLEAAVARVRAIRSGPVAAIGFSAGGHLIASLALRTARQGGKQAVQPLDAQVLVYPGIDARDWRHEEYNGFFHGGRWTIPKRVDSLFVNQQTLIEGVGPFDAPPTCIVGSTEDTYCVNAEHTDIYQQRLEAHGIPHAYVCGPFGEHGFQLMGGWTDDCIKWLYSRGFGKPREP